jgi:hypothetical protein
MDWKTALGLLAVAAFLLLASPGVRAVRAEPAGPGAAVCSAEARPVGALDDGAPEVAGLLERLRREAAAGAPLTEAGADPEALVPLNGRGYHYGAAPSADAAALRRELGAR